MQCGAGFVPVPHFISPHYDATRFPAPWSVEDISAAFVVKDNGGQKLLYVYYEEELLTRDEARRIAANVAKLPDFCHSIVRANASYSHKRAPILERKCGR
jgi:hypothetical protein